MIRNHETRASRWEYLVKKYTRYPAILIVTAVTFLLSAAAIAMSVPRLAGVLRMRPLIIEDILLVLWIILFFFYSDKLLFLSMGGLSYDRFRHRLNNLLNENPLFIWSIMSVIIVSLFLIGIENVFPLTENQRVALTFIDDLILLIFLTEFYLRYLAADEDKMRHLAQADTIIDLMALFPLLRIFRLMRFIRLLRFLRIAKLKKYFQTLSESMVSLAALWSENVFNFVIIIILIGVFLVFGTVAIYHIERPDPQGLRTVHDAFWWSLTMLFSGQPIEIRGGSRIIGAVMILSGIIITAILTGTVAASLSERLNSIKKGNTQYSFRDHVVICGWREEAAEMIGYIHQHMGRKKRHIVVIDDAIDELPALEKDVYFIKGNPVSEQVLMRANVPYASSAIILSGNGTGLVADQKTILATLAVESVSRSRCNRDIHTCAELIDSSNARNLERAYVNEMISIDDYSQDIIAQSAFIPGYVDLMNELLTNEKNENNIYKIVGYHYVGQTFRDAYLDLSDKNIIPIGVLREEMQVDGDGNPLVDELGTIEMNYRTFINPPHDFVISQYDRLFVISRPDDIVGWEVAKS